MNSQMHHDIESNSQAASLVEAVRHGAGPALTDDEHGKLRRVEHFLLDDGQEADR